MSRIFISHSTANNAEAIALRDWMRSRGWDDIFLDLDPERGLKAGERWQEALKRAAHRCELVIFLISPDWVRSKWCLAEFLLAKSLNKRVFGAVVAPTPFGAMPIEMTAEWQIVDLTAGSRDQRFMVTLPPGNRTEDVAFAADGLDRLAIGLRQAGLDARYFSWPPAHEPGRPPYRGLRPLEVDDAGIFFGREAPVIEAIDRLRGLTQEAPPRLMVILGASGAGKSSFLRAGLLPRLGRDPQTFLPLPVIRPERAAISGETGLISALVGAFDAMSLKIARNDIREAVAGGASTLSPLLTRLHLALLRPASEGGPLPNPSTLVLVVDQAEELFLSEAEGEARPLLALLRELVASDALPTIAVLAIRSDNYERLQSAPELDGVHQETQSLPPMPKGSYAEVVKGPVRRLDGTARALKIDDALVDALLADIEAGGAKDALPLLAFTLERLYDEFGATGHLTLDHYVKLGRVKGSIEAAVERAFKAADADARIPRDHKARLTLLRRGLIPWLAGIDPDTKAPRRRVARLSEIPAEARALIDLLVEQRLLATDVAKDTGETTIEPAHEALLRQWGLLQGWLSDDTGLLTVLDGIKRAARDWAANGTKSPWLVHSGQRLKDTELLSNRPDLSSTFEQTDSDYLEGCRKAGAIARRRTRRKLAVVSAVILLMFAAVADWWRVAWRDQGYWMIQVKPYLLASEAEKELLAGQSFKECNNCPEMVVVPSGKFPAPFAVAKFETTFNQWYECLSGDGCTTRHFGVDEFAVRGGDRPIVNVNWDDAQEYVKWLSAWTGKRYRLLSEAEWEYVARAGTTTYFPWGDDLGAGNANCFNCTSEWDKKLAPVGQFPPNAFGIFDMHGNVREWVEDWYHKYYLGAPLDGSSRILQGSEARRVIRGASYRSEALRSADRYSDRQDARRSDTGFRVARTLGQ